MDGEKEKTDKVDPNIPPKLDLKQAVSPQPPKKATTRIDMASAAMIPEEKSKTTRINLGSFGEAVPKTIKIQRPSEAATIKLNRSPAAAAATGPVTPLSPAPMAAPPSQAQTKRQTSRISLQEAFTAPTETPAAGIPQEAPAAPGPKTIRIKRPGDAGGIQETIHAPAAAPAPAPAAPAPAPAAAAPATVTAAPSDAGPMTQRKTIKLRRPGGAEGGEAARPSITLPKAAADFAAAQAAGVQAGEDEPGAAFGILSLVAVLVCAVLVYVLAVQAFPALGLSWPGQAPTFR